MDFLNFAIPVINITVFTFLDMFLGGFAIIFTALAYFQTQRRKFIYINIVAVLFFGLNVTLQGGYIGGLSTLVAIFLYLLALFTDEEKQKKLQFLMPAAVFVFYLFITDRPVNPIPFFAEHPELSAILLPIGSAITTFGIYQKDMFINKVVFSIGVAFWAAYSLTIQAYFAFATDFIGVFVLIFTAFKIKSERKRENKDGVQPQED